MLMEQLISMHRLEPGGLKIGNRRGSQMTYDIGCLFIYLFIY